MQFLEALKMSFFMLWETLWALVLGFGLSGVVQAFVSHEAMERKMGNHRPAAILRAFSHSMLRTRGSSSPATRALRRPSRSEAGCCPDG